MRELAEAHTLGREVLEGKVLAELHQIASAMGVDTPRGVKKGDLIGAILAAGPGGGSKPRPSRNGSASKSERAAALAKADQAPAVSAPVVAASGPASVVPPAVVVEPSAQRTTEVQTAPPVTAGEPVPTPVSSSGATPNVATPPVATPQATPSASSQGSQRDNGGASRSGPGPFSNPAPPPLREERNRQGGGGGGGGGRANRERDRDRSRRGRGRRGGSPGGGPDRGNERPDRGQQGGGPAVDQLDAEAAAAEGEIRTGILDVLPEGYGFLRTSGYLPGPTDVYVSLSQIRRFALRRGDEIVGYVRTPKDNEKYYALLRIETVAGLDPEAARQRSKFESLTPLFPDDRFVLEWGPQAVAERIMDLVAPLGKGQRGLIVSPPKAGKTTILKQIANGIAVNSANVHLIVSLVDERPEEVTDWQRTVKAAEVVYSTFDRPAEDHTQVAELVLERAKRLVEAKQDVVILLDSITRLARAYNLSAPASGRILSGGVDSTALYPPKKFFGAARNIEEGGSLTVIASALVETGSRMDEVIFEEFKGTGNSEIRLDRGLAEKRIYPAIDVEASGTRKEELLYNKEELMLVWRLRRVLHALSASAAMELLRDKIASTKSNEQFLKEINKVPVND